MKSESVKVRWSDGSEATIEPPEGGWLRLVVNDPGVCESIWGYQTRPLEDRPFHLACVYPKQLKTLALGELAQLEERT